MDLEVWAQGPWVQGDLWVLEEEVVSQADPVGLCLTWAEWEDQEALDPSGNLIHPRQ